MTTNYFDTFIEVAEDCAAPTGEVPPLRAGGKTVAALQYELIAKHPYEHTSDDVIFEVHAIRQGILSEDQPALREEFFAKGQACMRSSALTKRYGWGVHYNETGHIALVAVDSPGYKALAADEGLAHLKALRSRRA